MFIKVTRSVFNDAFQSLRPNNFSYLGLMVLFHYLTDLEEDSDIGLELDVIALCCEFSEDSNENLEKDYGYSLEELENITTVLKVDDDTSIIRDF